MCVCLLKILTEPAPFSDQLETMSTPYTRVSLEEARCGTPGACLQFLFPPVYFIFKDFQNKHMFNV